MMNRDLFEIMVSDYMADHVHNDDDPLQLIGAPYYDDDLETWVQDAEDLKCIYLLLSHDGEITIEYIGTK